MTSDYENPLEDVTFETRIMQSCEENDEINSSYLKAFEVQSILYQLTYLIFIIILRSHFTDKIMLQKEHHGTLYKAVQSQYTHNLDLYPGNMTPEPMLFIHTHF